MKNKNEEKRRLIKERRNKRRLAKISEKVELKQLPQKERRVMRELKKLTGDSSSWIKRSAKIDLEFYEPWTAYNWKLYKIDMAIDLSKSEMSYLELQVIREKIRIATQEIISKTDLIPKMFYTYFDDPEEGFFDPKKRLRIL